MILGADPYILLTESSEWKNDLKELPRIFLIDIYSFLIERSSYYTRENLRAHKSLEAYTMVVSGWLSNVRFLEINSHVLLTSEVKHSMRLSQPNLVPWIVLEKTSSNLLTCHCTCMAGLDEACSHVAALLLYCENVTEKIATTSVTDEFAYWMVPSKSNKGTISPKKIRDICLDTPTKILKHPSADKKEIQVRQLPTDVIHGQESLKAFLSDLEPLSTHSPLLMLVPPFHEKFLLDKFPLALNNLFREEYLSQPLEDLIIVGCDMNFELKSTDIEKIEMETRNQSKCNEWFVFRTGRITASKARAVCHVKRLDSNVSLIKSICYPQKNTFKSSAIQWGCDHEKEALKTYCRIMEESHEHFKLIQCGLFIHPLKPFLAASPDALISCDCCGKGIVEVKCPYCVMQNKSNIATVKYLIEDENGIVSLDRRHEYYYQVQTQMICTGLSFGDFFVWSPHDNYVERIYPDSAVTEVIVENSEVFFYNVLVPELLGRAYTSAMCD